MAIPARQRGTRVFLVVFPLVPCLFLAPSHLKSMCSHLFLVSDTRARVEKL